MCSIHSTAIADKGFGSLGTKDQARYEKKLAQLASEDTVDVPDGLDALLYSIGHWAKYPVLRTVRKFKLGNHRCYVLGRHQDCNYTVCYVMPNKRDEDDKPKDPDFRAMVLKTLSQAQGRVLPVLIEVPDEEL